MTEFNIDLTPIIDRVKERARHDFETNVPRAAAGIVSGLLNSGTWGKEGLAHEIIRKKVEDYVLSSGFEDKLDKIIEEVAEEQMSSAVKVLLQSRTRKLLFEATKNTEG